MVDPATGWFEIIKYKYKHADTIANLVDQTGLCIYLRLTIINYDFREWIPLYELFLNFINKNTG